MRWRKYRPANRVPCDVCIREIMDGVRHGAAGAASYMRMENDEQVVLCFSHAQAKRDEDTIRRLK